MNNPKFDECQHVWLHVPDVSTMTDSWTLLVIDNGNKILSFGENYSAGASVHVLDSSNYEIATWLNSEIAEDPELCTGAFIRAAAEIQFSDEQ